MGLALARLLPYLLQYNQALNQGAPNIKIMTVFCVFHRTCFGWSQSNLGPRHYTTLESAVMFSSALERGAFQVRAIDEHGNHAIVHERR